MTNLRTRKPGESRARRSPVSSVGASALEPQPQRLVVFDQMFQSFFQQVGINGLLQPEHDGLVVMVRIRQLLFEEPVLNRRQRNNAVTGFLFRRLCARGLCYTGKF